MPTLVVQLGHCFRTTGATGTTGEQEYAKKVGDACMALINGRGGWAVRLILADAADSSYAGDAFFAIHCDGSTSPAARGASVGYRTPEGQAAAQAWKRAYSDRGWPGFRPDNYTSALAQYYGTGTAVSRGNRRAVILECGFRTNAEDRALLDGPGGPERVALSIADALGIPVAPTAPPPEPFDREEEEMAAASLPAGTHKASFGRPYISKNTTMYLSTGFGARIQGRLFMFDARDANGNAVLRSDEFPDSQPDGSLPIDIHADRPAGIGVPAGVVQLSLEYSCGEEISVTWGA